MIDQYFIEVVFHIHLTAFEVIKYQLVPVVLLDQHFEAILEYPFKFLIHQLRSVRYMFLIIDANPE